MFVQKKFRSSILYVIVLVTVLSLTFEITKEKYHAYGGSGSFSFTSTNNTMSLPPSDFNFAAAGDWGCTSNTADTIKNIQNKDPELVPALGDFSYEKTGDCWLDEISPINNKLKIVMGNHEHGEEGDPTLLQAQYKNHFSLSHTYYSFDYHNVHFIAIDSMLPYAIDSPQYFFVKRDLISTSQNPDIKWIIVYFHHPMYTSPTKHHSDSLLRDTYHPLFDKYGVDLVLQGHNHNYQRSYPISYNDNNNNNSNANPYNPTITSINTKTYGDTRGQVYVIAGTGGEDLYDLKSKADFIATQYIGFGFLNVDVSSDGTKLVGTFYANDNADGGSVKDTFTITNQLLLN
jgi:predicted phosphodiesterase